MSLDKHNPIAEAEDLLSSEDDYSESPPTDIVAYNELRSCADVFRMYQQGQLLIDPDFQRDFIWPNTAQTRFIDSLIKQLPIPSMCISLDYKSQSRFVIDGLQRISTIIKFLSDANWVLSSLEDIDNKISGKDNTFIKNKLPNLYERVENLAIPITVIRCDYSKASHMNYLFTIFHRLNTGGSKLNNQEIRNGIYNGPFNGLLKKLAIDDNFERIINTKNLRFEREELILRFFTFVDIFEDYNGKLASFLNDYMRSNKNANAQALQKKENIFKRVTSIIAQGLDDDLSKYKFSKTLLEGVLVGTARNIESLERAQLSNPLNIKTKVNILIKDELFSVKMLSEGLSKRERVIERLAKAQSLMSA